MAMSVFGVYVYLLFWPAIVTFLLLLLPMPGAVKAMLRRTLLKVLFTKISIGPVSVSLFHLLFAISAITMVETIWNAQKYEEKYDATKHQDLLLAKWRSERNAWIATFTATLYFAVLRVNALLETIEDKMVSAARARAAAAQAQAANVKGDKAQ